LLGRERGGVSDGLLVSLEWFWVGVDVYYACESGLGNDGYALLNEFHDSLLSCFLTF